MFLFIAGVYCARDTIGFCSHYLYAGLYGVCCFCSGFKGTHRGLSKSHHVILGGIIQFIKARILLVLKEVLWSNPTFERVFQISVAA